MDTTYWNDNKRSFILLLDTSEKSPAEANGRDSYFGIGLSLTHSDVLNPVKWAENSNHLRQVLMEIRQKLMSV